VKSILLVIIFMSFSFRSAAYHICFSNADVGVPIFQIKTHESQFQQAIKEKNNDSIIYFMMWNKSNEYPVDSELYRLQNQAIFFDAVKGNKVNVVKRMIGNKKHIDLNRLTKVDYQLTALMVASTCGYKDMVKVLLNAGADVNVIGGYGGSNNITALSEARQLYNNDNVELEDMDEIIAMLKNAGTKK
jgi:hypothetical protein